MLMLFKLDNDVVDKTLYKVDSHEKFKYLKKNIVTQMDGLYLWKYIASNES